MALRIVEMGAGSRLLLVVALAALLWSAVWWAL